MTANPRKYPLISIIPLNAGAGFSHPPEPPAVIHLDDLALTAMQDLKLANAITIGPEAAVTEAELEMRVCHSHLLLVIDAQEQVVGLLGSEDLLGEKPLKVAQERKFKRAQIPVRLIMIPREKIIAFSLKDLKTTKIGQIIETLHYYQQHYGLVVETNADDQQQVVRGIFSLHKLSKQLGKDVTFDLSEAHSLFELHRHLEK